MKNKSLKGIVVLGAFILIQTGCTPQGNVSKEKLNELVAFRKRARFFRYEGNIDSAIVYYRKSLSICYTLIKTNDSTKDTIYRTEIAHRNRDIGFLYDSLNNTYDNSLAYLYDSSLVYLFESLKWAKLSKVSSEIILDNYEIGSVYYDYGVSKHVGSEECKKKFLNGIIYLRIGLRDADSLGIPKNKYILRHYEQLRLMFLAIGDAHNEEFYTNKYKELKAQLNTEGNQ